MERIQTDKRYTQGQRELLRLDKSKLSLAEQEELRCLLAPRSKYLPKTDTEAVELVELMLPQGNKILQDFIIDLEKEFINLQYKWITGDNRNIVYYKIMQNSKLLCSIGTRLNSMEVAVCLDEKECLKFEAIRNNFNRLLTQWIFDIAPFIKNKKVLYFDLEDKDLKAEALQLLFALKKCNKKEK